MNIQRSVMGKDGLCQRNQKKKERRILWKDFVMQKPQRKENQEWEI